MLLTTGSDIDDSFGEYHALLARQDAMRLRQQLLSPGRQPARAGQAVRLGRAGRAGQAGADGYDGRADQQTITRSLALVTPFSVLIAHLYEDMFERHPYLRRLFPESMDFQRAHLEQAFWYLIEHLDRPEEVVAFCTRLGRDHRKLGVRPVHFEVFEASLAEALRRTAGARWTEGLERAWLRTVRFAVTAMVAGADEAIGEPPYWDAVVTAHQVIGPGLAVLRVRTTEPYPYQEGQCAGVESPRLRQSWRPYVITGAASQGDGGGDGEGGRTGAGAGELEFRVRRTGPGGVSDALVSHTRVGDPLRLGPAQWPATAGWSGPAAR